MSCKESLLSTTSVDRPFWVGIAFLHSLMGNEDIAKDPRKVDVVLDLMGLLNSEAAPQKVLRQFYKVRNLCESVAYLPMFRLRKYLESQVQVSVDGEVQGKVDLAFRQFRWMYEAYQQKGWEFSEWNEDSSNIWVRFHWMPQQKSELDPVFTATRLS